MQRLCESPSRSDVSRPSPDRQTRPRTSRPPGPAGRRTVTALFADAVGSTSLGETHDEEVVFELMRACVERMTETVQRHDGVVTQFLGDGIVALFGAPTAFEGSARHAVAAALEMQHSLAEYATAAAGDLGVSYEFRVGLNTGPVVVGQISDDNALGFTALGD